MIAVNCLQAINGLHNHLTSYYLMCYGVLYLVLKINFHKGLHVKMKLSTVSTNFSSVFHSFICRTELKEGNEGIYGHSNASLHTGNQEIEDICLIFLNNSK